MRLLASVLPSLLASAAVLPAPATPTQVPEHLAPALDDLEVARIRVLVPPERPPGTSATVAESDEHFYRLLFTNDPEGALAHAEQVNVLVVGRAGPFHPPPEATQVEVRGTEGAFSCGAAACFLDWEEGDVAYSVGEFGSPEDAAAFAGSLAGLEELLTDGEADPAPAGPAEEGLPPALIFLIVATALVLIGGFLVLRRVRRP